MSFELTINITEISQLTKLGVHLKQNIMIKFCQNATAVKSYFVGVQFYWYSWVCNIQQRI